MKKALLIFCCLCFLLLAQSSFAVSFGVKLGFNTTSQEFTFTQLNNLGKLNKTGAEFGVFLEFPLVSTFSITTEIRYLQKGEQFDYFSWGGNLTNPDQTSSGRLSYVSFIALAKLKIPVRGINLYGLMGPRFDFKVGPKEVVALQILTDNYNSPIAGSIIGAGMEFKLGGLGWFLVEGYYSFDWKKLYDSA
ncbi:MAG: PorT family protein, partial [candidate division Zixibacteria bacterium]|nr:PorT family protein [candidate division Zixibacteria bacterium]